YVWFSCSLSHLFCVVVRISPLIRWPNLLCHYMHQGAEITTIEGLGSPENLHPMQAAFIKHDGFQCGYCTSGQICSSVAVLKEIQDGIPSHVTVDLVSPPERTADEIRERMSGNICRCGAYANILAAIEDAAGEIKS
uniref:2Fe-2S iron-sulfur cluster-binding protein n=2 Tax=Escherichia coli TaxID=562 RepID=UPI0030F473AC